MVNIENKNTNSTQFSDTLAWLESSKELIPKEVLECIYGGFEILKSLTEKGKLPKTNIGVQIDLLKKMGIISSSEKFSAKNQGKNHEEIKDLSSSELEEKLKNDLKVNKTKIEHCQKNTKAGWIALIKLRNEQKRIEGKLMELDKAKIEKMVLEEEKRLENPELLKKKLEEIEREYDIPDEELKVPTEPKLEPISENMFEEPAVFAKETTTIFNLEGDVKNSITGKIKTFYSERTKFNIEFSVIKEHQLVEQIYSYEQDNLFTAKVKNLGPKGFRVTYETISFLVVMISCYYIPINRISKMLSSHGKAAFGSSSICRYLKYFAECMLPIYLQLFEDLSETKVLNCDDTSTRTLETVDRIKFQNKNKEEFKFNSETKSVLNPDIKLSLFDKVKKELGFTSRLKNETRLKQKLNVTCLIGKSNEIDHKSYIVFYRTHLGSCGNLIEKLLEYRKPENKIIKIQSDLSDTNYPTSEFTIEKFGCLPHARRPFFKYKDLDPELCNQILEEFQMIAVTESMFKKLGFAEEYIFYTRFSQERPRLKKIFNLCKEILQKWPPKSELGKAANYFIENYDTIIKYIHHAEISSTNNVSERSLRGEKLMLGSSKFRQSENGRVIYDICRTIVATCNAAGTPLKEYFIYIMKNKSAVEENPQDFTPYVYAKKNQKATE